MDKDELETTGMIGKIIAADDVSMEERLVEILDRIEYNDFPIWKKNEIRNAIEKSGLNPDDKRPFRKYSLGMKQRIVFAQAIMETPDILFLDEPTNALDEEGVNDIRKIILEQKERGALICIASHNKEDIKMMADEVFAIRDGRIKQ